MSTLRFPRLLLAALAAVLLASCSGAPPPPSAGESRENYQEGHAKYGQ